MDIPLSGDGPVLTPMVDALEELVAFMESRRGRYHYEDGSSSSTPTPMRRGSTGC